MAKLTKGLLGGFSGKLGVVVGTYWKDIPVIRCAPGPRRTPATLPQLKQQEKFKLLIQFFRPITGLLNLTFENSAMKMTCFNKAISSNMSVIVGKYPEFRIDYAWVVLSRFEGALGDTPLVSSISPGILRFSWENGLGANRREVPDLMFVAAYCTELKQWIFQMFPRKGNDGTCHLDITPFSGYEVQSYIGFRPVFGVPSGCFSGQLKIL